MYWAYVHSQTNLQTCTKLRANRSSSLTASPDFWIYDPLKPPADGNAPWGIEERIVFSLCPFPDEFAYVDQIWCKSVQPFDSFPILLNIWPPKTPHPSAPLCIGGGAIYLAYIHSQMNPQTWTKVGANRSSRLTDSLEFWIFDPLKPPPKCPLVSRGAIFWRMSIPRRIRRRVPTSVAIVPAGGELTKTFECVTP